MASAVGYYMSLHTTFTSFHEEMWNRKNSPRFVSRPNSTELYHADLKSNASRTMEASRGPHPEVAEAGVPDPGQNLGTWPCAQIHYRLP